MKKRVFFALVGLLALTPGSSWAATTWQLQTKLSNASGTIKVRNLPTQTVVGSVVYQNFTTAASVPVTVNAGTGYKITSVKKGIVAQTISNDQSFSTDLFKSGGQVQSLVATFAARQFAVTSAAQGGGSVTPTSATVNYSGTAVFSATPGQPEKGPYPGSGRYPDRPPREPGNPPLRRSGQDHR